MTEAIEEMFSTAPYGSPPVPTMSSTMGSTASGWESASTASRKPTISSTVSPLTRNATSSPAIWADVASPAITERIAQDASSIERSRPSTRVPRMLAQLCSRVMTGNSSDATATGRVNAKTARAISAIMVE